MEPRHDGGNKNDSKILTQASEGQSICVGDWEWFSLGLDE